MGEATMKQRATKLSDHRVDLAKELDKRGVSLAERHPLWKPYKVDWMKRNEKGKYLAKQKGLKC